jgi:uncharacterized LabA/DUF88 family protein
MDLDSDPKARVMVFIDGQNLYKRCVELFGHPYCHPHLLAQYLAGPRTQNPVRCRFYTGRPDQNMESEKIKVRNLDRRLNGMRKGGVTVVTRRLRYHWDWGPETKLPRPGPNVGPQLAMLRPWRRPQEKGIDLVLALDVLEFLLTDLCDVAIVVSLDRDLFEIPQAIANLQKFINRPVRLEAAVPVPEHQKQPKVLPRFAFTHQITGQVFELVRDNTHYGVPEDQWKPPVIPLTLPERPPDAPVTDTSAPQGETLPGIES